MKRFILSLATLSILFLFSFSHTAHAAAGPLWLGSHRMNASFYAEIAKGNVPGHTAVHKYGQGTVGTSLVPITVTTAYETPTAATALEFVSDSVNDTAAGTGAREITVWGIDANYDELIQVIATNGTTAVPIPVSLLRVYRWKVTASGTYATDGAGSHAGTLSIRDVSDTPIWSKIAATPYKQAQSEISCYTVPDGCTAYLIEHHLDIDSAKSVNVVLMARSGIDVVTAPFTPMQVKGHYVGMKGHAVTPFKIPQGPFVARTDIMYMGVVTSGTADVSVHFTMIIVADGY